MDLDDVKAVMICSLIVFIIKLFHTIGFSIYLFYLGWGFTPVFGGVILPSIIILFVLILIFAICQNHVWKLANR